MPPEPCQTTFEGAPFAEQSGTLVRGDALEAKIFYVLVASALAMGLARRMLVGWDAPLWLDEAFTGTIAIQPTIRGLVQDCLNEIGGPVYYALMWSWAKLFGAGDVALRAPSFIFAIAAPLVIFWKGHPDKRLRLTWAALAALWMPGFYYATEARSYAQLFLLGSIQLILFCRLLATGSRRHVFAWAGVSSLLILTHTHAALQTAIQGLMFLVVYRQAALRHWPAVLLLVPAGLWILARLPLLIKFSNPQTTWLRLLRPRQLLGLPEYLLGNGALALPMTIILLGTLLLLARRTAAGAATANYSRVEFLPLLASGAAIAIIIGAGMITPSFTPRYLIPAIPGILFGIALWMNAWGPRSALPAGFLAMYLVLAGGDTLARVQDPKLDFRRGYSWEEASHYLRNNGVGRLIFVWDNPIAEGGDPGALGRVGAFFFDRDGARIPSDAVTIGAGTDEDFRRAVFEVAARTAGTPETLGVITLGRKLDLSKTNAHWTCQVSGGPEMAYAADVYVTACFRRSGGPGPR